MKSIFTENIKNAPALHPEASFYCINNSSDDYKNLFRSNSQPI